MKTILAVCIAGLFVISAFGAVAQQSDVNTINNNTAKGNRDFTHTVFAEDGTATWCGYCHYAREALDKIYTSGDYPFYYVCLVDDMDTHAASRVRSEYNIYGFPTVWFDYGYKTVVGGWTGAEAAYRTAITQSGARTVADIDVSLNVVWNGDAAMDITIDVKNNEPNPYAGHLHIYVTEVESSLGWKDTAGHPYTFPFLDYAFNGAVSVPSGNTWTNTISWDGHDYNNGHGVDFGTIQYGNIEVIAAVFNNTMHTGYSNPPSGYPFNAYYVDETAGFFVGDSAPNTPSNPDPANGATGVDVNKDLSWTGGPGSGITYDVYFGTASNPPQVATGQTTTTYNPGTMNLGTKYYWKIIAKNSQGASAEGPIWSFTTGGTPNQAPTTPTVTGPAKGKPGTNYTITMTSTDPETDQIYYFVDWGDGATTDWSGPFASGATASLSHTWATTNTYTVKVKAKDTPGAESAYGILNIKIPTKFVPHFTLWDLLQKLLSWFPLLERLLPN